MLVFPLLDKAIDWTSGESTIRVSQIAQVRGDRGRIREDTNLQHVLAFGAAPLESRFKENMTFKDSGTRIKRSRRMSFPCAAVQVLMMRRWFKSAQGGIILLTREEVDE